jgi:hypothetical protein
MTRRLKLDQLYSYVERRYQPLLGSQQVCSIVAGILILSLLGQKNASPQNNFDSTE